MISLIEFFNKYKEELKRELDKNLSIRQAEIKIQDFIVKYKLICSKEVLSHYEKLKVGYLIDIIKSSISLIISISRTTRYLNTTKTRPKKEVALIYLFRIVPIILITMLFKSSFELLLTGFKAEPLDYKLITPFIFLLIFLSVRIWSVFFVSNKYTLMDNLMILLGFKDSISTSKIIENVQVEILIDSDLFISKFESLINSVCKLIEGLENKIDATNNTGKLITDNLEVLEYFQDILEAEYTMDQIYKEKKLKMIPQLLKNYDIEIMEYPSKDIKNADIFIFENSIDDSIKKDKMVKPAFIKNNKCILKGLVIQPGA